MMTRQATVSNIFDFLTESERFEMQMINKRISKISEHVIFECTCKSIWSQFTIYKEASALIRKVDKELGRLDWEEPENYYKVFI